MSTALTLNLSESQQQALLAAIVQPGWATTLDLMADGIDAVKYLRAFTPNTDNAVSVQVRSAMQTATKAAIARGFFAPNEEMGQLLIRIGLPLRTE